MFSAVKIQIKKNIQRCLKSLGLIKNLILGFRFLFKQFYFFFLFTMHTWDKISQRLKFIDKWCINRNSYTNSTYTPYKRKKAI